MAENDELDVRPSKATPIAAGDPVEEVAVTGRAPDTAPDNSTFASRAKAAKPSAKAVESAENKAVAPKKAARK